MGFKRKKCNNTMTHLVNATTRCLSKDLSPRPPGSKQAHNDRPEQVRNCVVPEAQVLSTGNGENTRAVMDSVTTKG